MKPNLLISVVGHDSVAPDWFGSKRNYDILLICYEKPAYERFFGDFQIGNVDKIFYREGFNYSLIHQFVEEGLIRWEDYEYIFIPDDDVSIEPEQINKMFELMRKYDLMVAQPSCDNINFSQPITVRRPGNVLRYTGYVEVMMPCFSREAFEICLKTFVYNKSTWGIDILWWHFCGKPRDKFAILDCIEARHTRKLNRKGKFYTAIGVDPMEELLALKKEYDVDYNQGIYGVVKL